MLTTNLIGNILGVAFVLCLLHFTMNGMIRSELNINPYQKDSFAFRLKATKAPIFVLFVFIIGTYLPRAFGWLLVPRPWGFVMRLLYWINTNVLIVLAIALPIIFYNLLSYKKEAE
jgi:hypothetical protein